VGFGGVGEWGGVWGGGWGLGGGGGGGLEGFNHGIERECDLYSIRFKLIWRVMPKRGSTARRIEGDL